MIIGVCGQAGSGKSTVAQFILDLRPKTKIIHLADPMKRFCQELWGFTDEQLWGSSSARNEVDPRYDISPREALQQLGTDWGRKLDKDVWIRLALRRASQISDTPHIERCNAHSSLYSYGIFPTYNVVIPDVRFVNEMEAIKEAGGRLIGLSRKSGLKSKHASEQEVNSKKARALLDVHIANQKISLAQLKTTIEATLVKLGI